MAQHRHQSSLESVLDLSPSFFLTPPQNQKATALIDKLIWHYGLEQTVQKGYKPAILIQETYHRVASRDTFLRFFFSYIYEISMIPTNLTLTLIFLSLYLTSTTSLGIPARIQAK